MKKFIITGDGHLCFGRVYLHRNLLQHGEKCVYGGGLWTIEEGRGTIILYGRSFDFGPPDFDYVRVIEWGALGGSIGAWCGMMLFRHKTKHWKFRLGVPLIFILQFALLVYVYVKY